MPKKQPENLLLKIPARSSFVTFSNDENGIVTLDVENKGFFNRIAQKLLKKPKITHIHLDEIGSYVWINIDSKSDVQHIGELVEQHFGEKIHPTYERLAKYFQILESYKFIYWL